MRNVEENIFQDWTKGTKEIYVCLEWFPELEIVAAPGHLRTSSRIFRVSPALFIVRRIIAVSYALFGYFWVDLPDF